jgi:hypothetical protein
MRWIDSLELDVVEAWRPYFVKNKLSGYIKKMDGMTYGTIHGVGHMAS